MYITIITIAQILSTGIAWAYPVQLTSRMNNCYPYAKKIKEGFALSWCPIRCPDPNNLMYAILKRLTDFSYRPPGAYPAVAHPGTSGHPVAADRRTWGVLLSKRIGYRNRPFYIWKFATMVKNSPNIGTGEITLRNDPRVTSFGRFLRKTKINELPQIINVLKGDMSIVGPGRWWSGFNLYSPEVRRRSTHQTRHHGYRITIFRDEENTFRSQRPREMYAAIYPYKAELEMVPAEQVH